MPRSWCMAALGLSGILLAAPSLLAQLFDPIAVLESKKPPSKIESDREEALRLYAEGLMAERDNRLVEALRCLERARQLDSQSTLILRALVPLYLALDRAEDALQAGKNIVDRDTESAEAWYQYARQLKGLGRAEESLAALVRAAACALSGQGVELHMQILFDLGVTYENRGDWSHAEESFKKLVAQLEDPTTFLDPEIYLGREDLDLQASEILERLGRLALKNRRFDEAHAYYLKARKCAEAKEPSRAQRLSFNLAEVLTAQGRWREALPPLDDYLNVRPQGLEAYQLKITILNRTNQTERIIPFLEGAVARDANNEGLKLLLVRQMRAQMTQRGDDPVFLVKTENCCVALARSSPGLESFHELFGYWKDRHDMAKLLAFLKSDVDPLDEEGKPTIRLAIPPHAAALVQALGTDRPLTKDLLTYADRIIPKEKSGIVLNTTLLLGVIANQTKDWAHAERYYRLALGSPALKEGQREAEVYLGLLQVLWQAHKYQALADLCEQGLKDPQMPNRVLFHRELARAAALLGKPDQALDNINKSIELSFGDDQFAVQRIRLSILLQLDQVKTAIEECQALMKQTDRPEELRSLKYILSAAYSQGKEIPKAVEQLQSLLSENPDDAGAHNDLGYLWADNNDRLDEAEKHIRLALELDRKQRESNKPFLGDDAIQANAAFLDSLGWVLFRKGQLRQACDNLEKAAALDGGLDDPVVWDHLGDVYARLKDTAKAKSAWRKSLLLYDAPAKRPRDDRFRELAKKIKSSDTALHSN